MTWLFRGITYGEIPGITVGMQKEKKNLLNKKVKIRFKVLCSKNIHRSNTMQTKQGILRNIHACTQFYVHVVTITENKSGI